MHLIVLLFLVLLCGKAMAQVVYRGLDINEQAGYFIKISLKPDPTDRNKYNAQVDVNEGNQGVYYYLQEGQEFKTFEGKTDLVDYMEQNRWFYLMEEKTESAGNKTIVKYAFRKSMKTLEQEKELISENKSENTPQ